MQRMNVKYPIRDNIKRRFIMGLFGKKVEGKKVEVKNYGSVMEAFSTVIVDLKEVTEREERNVSVLESERSEIESQIEASRNEIDNCSTAIDNVQGMFPNL